MWKLKIAEGSGAWLTTVSNHVGRQFWEFDPNAGTYEERAQVERVRQEFKKNRFQRKQSADLLMRMQLIKENPCGPLPPAVKLKENENVTDEAVTTTLKRAISFYSSLQTHDGHWPGESAGPFFVLQPLVLVLYVTGALNAILSSEHQKEIKRYLYNHQNEDGGWGLHIEGPSTMFGTAISYIALRLLGEGPEDGEDRAMASGRNWILDHGGAAKIPSWGKIWLSVLGVHEWAGCNPVPPELWLFPKQFPIHPGKMRCYCRLLYLSMSYLYGKRFVGPITELVRSLRQELYVEPYNEIQWKSVRNTCAKEDMFHSRPLVQSMAWEFLYNVTEPVLRRWPFCIVREKALKTAMEYMHYEDQNSNYVTSGSLEKAMNLLACWVEDPNSEAYKFHLARIPDFLWVAEDGLKVQSFGSQTWDTEFSIEAIISSNLTQEYGPVLRKAHDYLKASQVQENPSGNFTSMWRHISKGSWTFSARDHGWPVSDCTAQGLKATLLLSQLPPQLVGEQMELKRLYESVDFLLTLQSRNGGFTAWEPQRAFGWVEKFNPIEFADDVLLDREHVECTSSVLQALVLFKKLHPEYRIKDVENCISGALRYVEETQNHDGSWYGTWGICYTYGTMFAVLGLQACGLNYRNSPALRKACQFLLSKQLPCGGWGESYLSSQNQVYTNLKGDRSNLVHTSWALLSLIVGGQAEIDAGPIHGGMKVLINSQMEDGDFPQQEIVGSIFKTCTLQYSSYRNIYPIWALGEYRRRVLFA